ncbi:hypothetical protein DPMN_041005 [Dreissena polymorpha]|uniref:Uncharacterized protein n=1 Tax=Dreissena polymorpha TaxID=45954 RepID=A0A9D4CW22_DREPO|nr:hypothetical protein DPMN_041005 [Dreissena polymorpha]
MKQDTLLCTFMVRKLPRTIFCETKFLETMQYVLIACVSCERNVVKANEDSGQLEHSRRFFSGRIEIGWFWKRSKEALRGSGSL